MGVGVHDLGLSTATVAVPNATPGVARVLAAGTTLRRGVQDAGGPRMPGLAARLAFTERP